MIHRCLFDKILNTLKSYQLRMMPLSSVDVDDVPVVVFFSVAITYIYYYYCCGFLNRKIYSFHTKTHSLVLFVTELLSELLFRLFVETPNNGLCTLSFSSHSAIAGHLACSPLTMATTSGTSS